NSVGDPLSVSETLTVTVSEVNDAPTRTAGTVANLTVAEDSGTSSLGLGAVSYSAGPANESALTLTYTVTAVPAASLGNITLANGTTVVTAGTSYTLGQIQGMKFVAAADANGMGAFSYTVTDNGTTNSVGDPLSVSETLTVTVSEVNDAPTRTAGTVANLTVAEDSGTSSLGLGAVSYSAGPGNESAQTLTYTVTAVPAASLGNITLANGTTVVTAGTSYTLGQIQGMKFVAAADANGTGA